HASMGRRPGVFAVAARSVHGRAGDAMNTRSILYIEDEEDYQMLVQRILGKVGFEVTVADTAQEGLSALRRQRPQLLLLDINLPDTEGNTICRQLREDPAFTDLPIVML